MAQKPKPSPPPVPTAGGSYVLEDGALKKVAGTELPDEPTPPAETPAEQE